MACLCRFFHFASAIFAGIVFYAYRRVLLPAVSCMHRATHCTRLRRALAERTRLPPPHTFGHTHWDPYHPAYAVNTRCLSLRWPRLPSRYALDAVDIAATYNAPHTTTYARKRYYRVSAQTRHRPANIKTPRHLPYFAAARCAPFFKTGMADSATCWRPPVARLERRWLLHFLKQSFLCTDILLWGAGGVYRGDLYCWFVTRALDFCLPCLL